MRVQGKIVITAFIITIIAFIGYTVLKFIYFPAPETFGAIQKDYICNIMLALFGSAALTLLTAVITYSREKKRSLELYLKQYRKIFSHASAYQEMTSSKEKTIWFKQYCIFSEEFNDIWSDIRFLYDPASHYLYLKSICDFYNSLILLLQNDFRILENCNAGMSEKICTHIDKVIFFERKSTSGLMTMTSRMNRLTDSMQMDLKAVDEIYLDRKRNLRKKYKFKHSLVNNDTFIIVSPLGEEYIKKIKNLFDETNCAEVEMEATEDILKELKEAGYISYYYKMQNGKYHIDCQFILDYYQELKSFMSL